MNQTRFYKIYAIVIGAAILLLAIAYYQTSQGRVNLRDRSYNMRVLINEITRLEATIGYGGFIHNFKNAVLRPEEPDFIAAARADYAEAQDRITRIMELSVIEEIDADLTPLIDTLAQYAVHLDRVETLNAEGRSRGEVDAIVRMQDEEAVASLSALVDRAHVRVQAVVARYVVLTNWMYAMGFAVIILLALSVLLFTRISHANQLMREARYAADLAESEARADRMLAGEMRHRLNNLMAAIQSINRQTARTTKTAEEHSDALLGRINALTLAHNLAFDSHSDSAQLIGLLEKLAGPYQSEEAPRITVSGTDIRLRQHLASQVSLVMHELLTNAAKYGALRSAGGEVHIRASKDDAGTYEMSWTETGGPRVSPPKRTGFGTRFIQQVVEYQMHGECRFDYRPEGLLVRMTFPLVPGDAEQVHKGSVSDDSATKTQSAA